MESETSHATPILQHKLQLADCRLGTKLRIKAASCLIRIRDNMSSKNMPSVKQSLFRSHLSPASASGIFLARFSHILSLTKRAGHRLFICCLPTSWIADLREADMLLNAKTVKTADNPRSKIVMCYVTCPRYPIVCCYFKYWHDSSRTRWEDMWKLWRLEKGRKSVAWPIRVACDNTDSIFLPRRHFIVCLSQHQSGLCSNKNVLVIWGRLQAQHFLIFPQIVPFSIPLSANLNSQAGYRCILVPRLPFPVLRSQF